MKKLCSRAQIFKMRPDEIATKSDIELLHKAILELREMLNEKSPSPQSKYLRSSDVKKLLNISDGTLQRLRTTGTLKATKINGTWFYDIHEINKMLKK